ncbi:hypothetical protein MNV49_005443 [Pseudohyphozyma bogoriensis]|nr:hypothetical protein MNV49_005443 [Pseudohyphozyma bogoriensis]
MSNYAKKELAKASDNIKADATSIAGAASSAAKSGAYLYPLRGIYYVATHPSLISAVRPILVKTATLSAITIVLMFVFTYLPQDMIFDAVLVQQGQQELVKHGRKLGGRGGAVMLGKSLLKPMAGRFSIEGMLRYLISLPLNAIPGIGTAFFLFYNGRHAGPSFHARYFQLKSLSASDKRSIIQKNQHAYTAFGATALGLQLIPVVGMVFAFTTAAGAALWAVEMERKSGQSGQEVELQSGQVGLGIHVPSEQVGNVQVAHPQIDHAATMPAMTGHIYETSPTQRRSPQLVQPSRQELQDQLERKKATLEDQLERKEATLEALHEQLNALSQSRHKFDDLNVKGEEENLEDKISRTRKELDSLRWQLVRMILLVDGRKSGWEGTDTADPTASLFITLELPLQAFETLTLHLHQFRILATPSFSRLALHELSVTTTNAPISLDNCPLTNIHTISINNKSIVLGVNTGLRNFLPLLTGNMSTTGGPLIVTCGHGKIIGSFSSPALTKIHTSSAEIEGKFAGHEVDVETSASSVRGVFEAATSLSVVTSEGGDIEGEFTGADITLRTLKRPVKGKVTVGDRLKVYTSRGRVDLDISFAATGAAGTRAAAQEQLPVYEAVPGAKGGEVKKRVVGVEITTSECAVEVVYGPQPHHVVLQSRVMTSRGGRAHVSHGSGFSGVVYGKTSLGNKVKLASSASESPVELLTDKRHELSAVIDLL